MLEIYLKSFNPEVCDCFKSVKPEEDQADHLLIKRVLVLLKQMLTLRFREQFLVECQN